MMHSRRTAVLAVLALAVSCVTAPVLAAERATQKDAVALVKKAIAYIKENGKDKAFAEFSNPGGKFRDRDLYITVTDMSGTTMAHGANARLIGKNLMDVKDPDGKSFIRSFIDTANTKGSGWVDYKWPNPVSKVIEDKATYVEKVDDVVVGAGIYK